MPLSQKAYRESVEIEIRKINNSAGFQAEPCSMLALRSKSGPGLPNWAKSWILKLWWSFVVITSRERERWREAGLLKMFFIRPRKCPLMSKRDWVKSKIPKVQHPGWERVEVEYLNDNSCAEDLGMLPECPEGVLKLQKGMCNSDLEFC